MQQYQSHQNDEGALREYFQPKSHINTDNLPVDSQAELGTSLPFIPVKEHRLLWLCMSPCP